MVKVTVVIPIYNHAPYLERCLESVAMQKTDFAFNALLLDDASTDGSSDIVRTYTQKYPEIFIPVIRETNWGVVENIFNATVEKINAPYHAAVEGDDFWTDENKLQIQADALDAHPDIDLCGHQTSIHYVNQDKEDGVMIQQKFHEDITILEGIDNLIRPHTCSRMYRTKYDFSEVTNKAGVVYDTCVYWYYMLHNPKMIYINKDMSTYNVHDKGMFSGANRKARKYQGLFEINALNEVTNHQFEQFNFKRFLKALPKKDKPLFLLKYFFNKNKKKAYNIMLDKYKPS